jgi:peptide/nickel transport system permease protein
MAEVSETARAGAATAKGLALAGAHKRQSRSLWSDAWRQYRKHRLALTGTFTLLFIGLAVIIGPLIYPVSPESLDVTKGLQAPALQLHFPIHFRPLGLQAPVTAIRAVNDGPLGYDDLGHDMLSRLLSGGRKSLLVGLMAALVSIVVGTLVGSLAGFFGKALDSLLMRITDLFIALPQLPLLLLISFLYSDKLKKLFGVETGILVLIVLVIGILNWMAVARLARASFLSLKEKEFVEAARCIGATSSSIMFKHILPNVLSPIIVAATLGVGSAIITESSLSFLGLGFPPDVPTWGSMLFVGKDQLPFAPWIAVEPGLLIFLVVLSINYMGDGLRDALDPRSRV